VKNKIVKWILGVIGTIFISAIGSGLWIHFLGGFTSNISKAILTIATLGLNSLRDHIYLNIARGFHEVPSLMILLFVLLIPMFFLSSLLGRFLSEKILKDIKNNINKDKINQRCKIIRTLSYFFLFAAILLCLLQFFVINYENIAVTYFYQSLLICKPFIDSKYEDILLSRFAQIKSKKDYVELITELNDIAESNNTKLPKFYIF